MNNNIFNSKEFVEEYYKLIEDYDNSFIVEQFKLHIPKNSSVLELGFGTGMDYFSLKDMYNYTVSDYSKEFINKFYKLHGLNALFIDARDIVSDYKYDCIFSNKVLHVFNDDDLVNSFASQKNVLNDNGYIFHTFWYEENAIGNEFANNVNEEKLIELISTDFSIVKLVKYSEMEDNDSVLLIAKKARYINL